MAKSSKKPIETQYLKIKLEDGIIFCEFTHKLNMDLDIAKHCVIERLAYSNGQSYPCLINMKKIKSLSKEAREYLAKEGTQLVTVGAILSHSTFTRLIANIFLTVNKPKVPTKLFNDEQVAIEWLKKYL